MFERQEKGDFQEKIIQELFKDCNSVMSQKEAKERVQYLLDMLTFKQNQKLCERVQLCNFYLDARKKGMQVRRLHSISSRKFKIDSRKIKSECRPCALVWG